MHASGWRLGAGLVAAALAITAASAAEVTRYSYDALGRLVISDSRRTNGSGYSAGYGFDRASNRTTYQNASVVRSGILPSGASLAVGQGIISPDAQFRLTLQYDGNLVLYAGPSQYLWATMTFQPSNGVLSMQGDGNLVLYSGSQLVWYTHTEGHPGAYLSIQNDGNMVVYDPSGAVLWSRF